MEFLELIFAAQVLSSIQVTRELLLPQLRFHLGYRKKPVAFFTGSTWLSLVSRSLVRSAPIATLMAVSQVLSWQLIMPNSVVWAWTENIAGRWQVLLSSMRAWELVLVVFVWLWEAVVALLRERLAYAFTSRTFISLPEVVAITGLVALLRRKDLLSVSDKKYAYDGQRLADWSSFVGAGGYANTYNADHDRVRSSDAQYWAVVYGPLARLVAVSLAGFAVLVLLKMVYYSPDKRRSIASFADVAESSPLDSVSRWLLPYERLPVETLLDEPIRAKSLLRFRFEMELTTTPTTSPRLALVPVAPIRYLYAPLYFTFGSLVDAHGQLVRRHGFVRAIPPCIDLSAGISESDSVALTGSTLARGGLTRAVGAQLTRGMSSTLVFAARRASLRFAGHQHAASEPPRRRTGACGDGSGAAAQWLSERWAGRRFSFNVAVH